jgi:putative intracellular protease/amidase
LHAKSNWQPIIEYLDDFFSDDANIRNLKGIFTVCTGSMLLARSRIRDTASASEKDGEGGGSRGKGFKGTLDGINVTTNKRNLERAKDEHPNVLWEPQARWVNTTLDLPLSTTTTSKKIKLWTTSGVSAGIDGIFALISDEYGPDIAEYISQALEYNRTIDPKNDPFAPKLP